ncbi:ribonuclease inhibitor [Galactobacter valiniphilus]|uniref:ribonuclease inhibitor n=1 Tax=Galactobacter valiniphilus TaxID=2676122 RepID=UPI0018F3E451|nr:ribonuclease inhibitor [Galactobacter valiniphilus]
MVIDGAAVDSIAAFYAELNQQLMRGEDWELGPSLDALNDLLYGGIGALAGAALQRWEITDHAAMAAALGVETTRKWLLAKLDPEGPFDRPAIRERLARLEATGHETYFELLLEVFADHPQVELLLR